MRQYIARRPGTLSNHKSALRTLMKFTKTHRLNYRQVSASNIAVFIERLALTSSSPDSINNTISALRQCFKKMRLCTSRFDDLLVKEALTSVSKSLRHEPSPSQPVPPELLQNIVFNMENDHSNTPLVAFVLLSFCTLLRQSSITPRNVGNRPYDDSRHMCRKDLVYDGTGFMVDSKWSKSDQIAHKARHSRRLPIIPDSILCPTRALKNLLLYTPTRHGDQPLIMFPNGSPMPSSYISRKWLEITSAMGLPRRPFTLHCLRKSGTDFLMSITEDEQLIKEIGDWRSSQVRRYYKSRAHAKANVAFARLSHLPKLCR